MDYRPAILALDLGNQMGWAIHRGGDITSGTLNLNKSKEKGVNYNNFKEFLDSQENVVFVYYEKVEAHTSRVRGRTVFNVYAAHAYGAFQAILFMYCERIGIDCKPVGVGTIKKHWTGNGRAKKAAMIAHAVNRGFNPKDDNEADALAILDIAMVDLGVKKPEQNILF